MSSSLNSVLKSCLVWCLLFLFLSIPVVLVKLWKLFVVLCAKILRPKLTAFRTSDVMTIADGIYTKPLINIGFVLKLSQRLEVEEFRNHFYKTLLEPIDPRTGRRLNVNLLHFFKKFWGYPFKHGIKLRDIDLKDLIYESSLRNGETFSDFVNRFFYFPYEEGKPLWNAAIIQGVNPYDSENTSGGSILLFRLHHSMGDGYSLIYLFEQLAGKSTSKKTEGIFQETMSDKIRLWFNSPVTMYDFAQKLSKISNPFPMSGSNTEVIYSFFTLDLDSVKRIRKRTAAHVTSILLTLLGSVLRTLLSEQKGSDAELPEYICTAHSLPWPDHPKDKMCNEWTVGMFKIPIKNSDVLKRLEETERDYVEFHNKEIHKMIKRTIMPLTAMFPVSLIGKSAKAETNMSTSWATIVAGNDYKLMGNDVLNVWPFVGFTSEKMALVTVSLSHSQTMDVTLGVNREFLSETSAINRMVNNIFPEELKKMVRIAEALN